MSELVFRDFKEETKMVRPPSFDSSGMKKGAWSEEEDNKLRAYVEQFGHSNWRLLPLLGGLARCGKSCRLRWMNYLKPGVKRGNFSKQEEDLIIKLHAQLGNKWSAIAAKLPGRTDNDIKNYWHAHINKRSKRNGAVTRARRAQMPQEGQSSSEIDSCTTTDHQEKPASENMDALNPIADIYPIAQTQGDLYSDPYQTCFSQLNIDLPPFLDEELHDFGVCESDMSTFSDSSSDGGVTCWNPSTAESQENFWSEPLEEDTFYVVLW